MGRTEINFILCPTELIYIFGTTLFNDLFIADELNGLTVAIYVLGAVFYGF